MNCASIAGQLLAKPEAEKQAKLDKHKWMSADDVQGVLKSEREKRLGAVEMMKDESRKLHKEVLKQMNKKKKKRLQERTDDADYFAVCTWTWLLWVNALSF